MQFDRILRLDSPAPVTRWEADVGALTIGDGSAHFDGKTPVSIGRVVSVDRVHSKAYAHDLVQVDYVDGDRIATVYFGAAYRRGAEETIGQIVEGLGRLSESGGPAEIDAQAIGAHRQVLSQTRAASNHQAAMMMWGGAVLCAAGLVAALATGGGYLLAWAAVFLGIGTFIGGYVRRQK